MKIIIEYRNDDPKLREVVPLYWEFGDKRLYWAHKVTDLAAQFGYGAHQTLSKLLREQTVAYFEKWKCVKCGRPVRTLGSRENFRPNMVAPIWITSAIPCSLKN